MSDKIIYSGLDVKGEVMAQMLSIWGEYSFPQVDGTLNQILSTDGAGLVSWISANTLGLTTSDIPEGSNLYFTNERVDDRVSHLIQSGTGINWSYDDSLNVLTPTVTLSPFTTSNLSEGSNLYFINERVDDRVSQLIQNGTGISWTYNDSLNTFTANVTLSGLTTSNLSEGSNLYFTDERVDDRVALLIKNGTGISWTYNDLLNTLTPTVTLSPFTTSNLSEGSNLYFTDERVDDRVSQLIKDSATVTWTYNDLLGTLTANAIGTPLSVQKNGTLIGSRGTIDFVEGSNITFGISEDTINNKIIVQVDSSGTSTDSLIDITHSSLVALKTGSSLVPGAYYRITNFQTIYDQPDYDINGDQVVTPVVKTASISPIIVKAIGSAELAKSAYQPEFPNDFIEYQLEYTTPITNTLTKGRITKRRDSNGNTTNYDHRTVLFKRYLDSNSVYSQYFDSGLGSSEMLTFGGSTTDTIIDNLLLSPQLNYTFDLPNIVLLSDSEDNLFEGAIENFTCTGPIYGSKLTYRIKDTLFNGTIQLCNINNIGDSILNGNISYWNISSYFQTSTVNISSTSTLNTFKGFLGNTLDVTTFSYNEIIDFRNNTVSDSVPFTGNKLNQCINNDISSGFSYNTFSGLFSSNTIVGSDGYFNRNSGVDFISNSTIYICANNNFGKNFQSNSLGDLFGYDQIGDGGGNTFRLGAYNCTFGVGVHNNIFEGYVTQCTTNDNGFKYNDCRYPISNVDFTMATHVYGEYNTQIYKSSTGDLRLSYYGENDSRETVNITE